MNCNNCARHVTDALQAVDGVASASVELDAGQATVLWRPGAAQNVADLVAAVGKAGFEAAEWTEDRAGGAPESADAAWRFNVWFGALLTAPLLVGDWVLGWGMHPGFQWLGLAFAGPVLWVCGRSFYAGAWRQLRQGQSNMDTLVALGSTAAFAFSVWGLLSGYQGHLYFMEAAAIVTLISTGHWLEARTTTRAASALQALLQLTPATALRRFPDGDKEVPVMALQPGDQVTLRPGDRVPVDGEVLEGESALDEAMLTGEPVAVDKRAGDRLYAGTLNLNGRVLMRVTATGEATALAQIVAVVRRAQTSRASIQRLADRVSSVFVPVVVLVAVLTGLWWILDYETARRVNAPLAALLPHVHTPATPLAAGLIHAVAVLIVACPCAMGLATPVAIMAGANAAARRGILIRDGQALEKTGRITAVAFDKTGTLTQSRLQVIDEASWWSEALSFSLRAAVRGLAQHSHHPLSQVAAQWARQAGTPALDLSRWQELRGRGCQATYAGTTLRLGSLDWLRESGVRLDPVESFAARAARAGATVLGIAQDATLLGALALRDSLKPHAAEVVQCLTRRGLHVYLITGDQPGAAQALARELGLPEDRVLAGVRPEQKAATIQALQSRGQRVAFVGDGINDAPAVEQADLGIAVSRASDVAREASDVILLNTDIQSIPEALGLAQATLRTIRQNLFWAFFYNTAAIPLAALGLMSPVICALAMGLSDLVVVGNALRLSRWRG